jgi:integrase
MAGQIISKGERTWLVRIFAGRDPITKKKQYDNYTVHGIKKEAQAFVNAKLRERDLGVYTSGGRVTIGRLLDGLLLDYRVNDLSYGWAEGVVRVHLRPLFGAVKAASLGSDLIQRYIEKRREPHTREYTNKRGTKYQRSYGPAENATINNELALLRRAYSLGQKATPPLVGVVPFIPELKVNNIRKGFFEADMFLALVRELPEEIRPLAWFGYCTGCRVGEIKTLQWAQADLDQRVVRLEPGETKNDDGRIVPLVEYLYQVLKFQREIRDRLYPDSPWMFSRAGRPIRCFRASWAAACKRAGLVNAEGEADKLFHDLRRTGVRNLIRSGVSEKVAMTISGHKSRSMLDRYNIVDERDLKNAAAKLGDYMAQMSQLSEECMALMGAPAATKNNRHTIDTPAPSTPVN